MNHDHDRWTFDTYVALAAQHQLPRLAAFFTACSAARVPDAVPTRLAARRLTAFADALRAHGVRMRDCTAVLAAYAEDFDGVEVDNAYVTPECPWEYESHYGGHPALPSLTHCVCLAAVDECLPSASWRVRRILEDSELTKLIIIADGLHDVIVHALYEYDHLPDREIVVAERCAPFIIATIADLNIPWAIGVAYRDVLLGLSTLIEHTTGAGTRILDHWKTTRNWLIAHHVTNRTYFTAKEFDPVPHGNHQPLPGQTRRQHHMCWQIDPQLAATRIDQLDLSWYDGGVADEEDDTALDDVDGVVPDTQTTDARWHSDAERHPTEVRLLLTVEEYTYVAQFQQALQRQQQRTLPAEDAATVTIDAALATLINTARE